MLTNTDLLETCQKDVTILWAYLIRPFRVITDFRLISRQNYIVTHKKIPDSNMRRYNFNNFSRSIYHVFSVLFSIFLFIIESMQLKDGMISHLHLI